MWLTNSPAPVPLHSPLLAASLMQLRWGESSVNSVDSGTVCFWQEPQQVLLPSISHYCADTFKWQWALQAVLGIIPAPAHCTHRTCVYLFLLPSSYHTDLPTRGGKKAFINTPPFCTAVQQFWMGSVWIRYPILLIQEKQREEPRGDNQQ